MEQLAQISLGVVLFGGVFDLLTKRVPNWLNFPAMAVGLGLQLYWGSWTALAYGAAGLLTGFILFFPLYIGALMGAGDVKLLMVVGAWSNPLACLRIALLAILIGGLYAAGETIYRGRFLFVMRSIYRFIRSIFLTGLEREYPQLDKERKFPFGICLAMAMMVLFFLQTKGIWT